MSTEQSGTVRAVRHGKVSCGEWIVAGEIVTVCNPELGMKTTELNGLPPRVLAELMLGQMMTDRYGPKRSRWRASESANRSTLFRTHSRVGRVAKDVQASKSPA